MIDLTLVVQNELDKSNTFFDKLLKEMTNHKGEKVQMLQDFERMIKMDTEKEE